MWKIWIRKSKCSWGGFDTLSSSFDHPSRGTWYNKRYKTWLEIDGFVTTREERIKWIRNVRTHSEFYPI